MSDLSGSAIQWFPGHMTKTLRLMEKEIKNVDLVLVLLDARIPHSSQNPEIERICRTKPRLYLLNKADLADPAVTRRWQSALTGEETACIALSSKKAGAAGAVKPQIDKALAPLLARRKEKGMQGARTRIMLVGIPNVGKSTFINNFAKAKLAKAADKPGVTRGKQWISLPGYELLDMPGVLWKKFEDPTIATNLAFIGSIKDDLLDMEEIAMRLLEQVKLLYPERLAERYKLKSEQLEKQEYELLGEIAKNRGMRISGGEVDLERAAIMVVDEFRGCKLGPVSLERPEDFSSAPASQEGNE